MANDLGEEGDAATSSTLNIAMHDGDSSMKDNTQMTNAESSMRSTVNKFLFLDCSLLCYVYSIQFSFCKL